MQLKQVIMSVVTYLRILSQTLCGSNAGKISQNEWSERPGPGFTNTNNTTKILHDCWSLKSLGFNKMKSNSFIWKLNCASQSLLGTTFHNLWCPYHASKGHIPHMSHIDLRGLQLYLISWSNCDGTTQCVPTSTWNKHVLGRIYDIHLPWST